jgi:predicted permease
VIVAEPAATPVTVAVAVLEPAGIVTLAVTVATPVLLLDKLTTAPNVFDKVTVNVPVALVLTVSGFGVSVMVG